MGHDYDVELTNEGAVVESVPETQREKVEAGLAEAYRRVESEHERVREECLHRFEGNYPVQNGVYEGFESRGWVQPTGFGKVVYSGSLAKVFAAVDKLFLNLCEKNGAQQEVYPAALEAKSLSRAGYFNTFAQHAFFVAPLKTTLEALELAKTGLVFDQNNGDNKSLQSPEWVLSPTVCHHCFEARKDHSLNLPFKVTALNQCARYEVHGTRSLERLRLYWMREFIHFDSEAKAIVESLDAILADTVRLLTRWGVSPRSGFSKRSILLRFRYGKTYVPEYVYIKT